MGHFGFTTCSVLASVVFLAPQDADAQWGTIKGQVKVAGTVPQLPVFVKKGDTAAKDPSVCAAADIPDESLLVDPQSNGLANVVIWLSQKPATIHPDLAKSKKDEVIFNQKGCRYVPHVLVVRTDQYVRVMSDDEIAHNLHPEPLKNQLRGLVLRPRSPEGYLVTLRKEEKLPITVTCDIHSWMRGYWVVIDHPYATVTNSKGEFEIADLPEGEHTFKIWQERIGIIEKAYQVVVKPGLNKLEPIEIASDRIEK